jgi:cell wall-associated NlpC family hydrolase
MEEFDSKRSEEIAQELLGSKFLPRGRGIDDEFDCYGLAIYYYKQFGFILPDYAYEDNWGENEKLFLEEYANYFKKIGKDEIPQTGDMVIMFDHNRDIHIGVMLDKRRFVHTYKDIGAKIDRISGKPWGDKIYGFFRVRER